MGGGAQGGGEHMGQHVGLYGGEGCRGRGEGRAGEGGKGVCWNLGGDLGGVCVRHVRKHCGSAARWKRVYVGGAVSV